MCMCFPPSPPDPTLTLEKVAAVLMEVEGSLDEVFRTQQYAHLPSSFRFHFSLSGREDVAHVWALQFLLCKATPTWKMLGSALNNCGHIKAAQLAKAYVTPGKSVLVFLL